MNSGQKIILMYSHESPEAVHWTHPPEQVSFGLCHFALQISSGQSKSSRTSSSDESSAADTAPQITESNLSGLASGRRLHKEDSRTEKQKSAIRQTEPDPAKVPGKHS